ncbi:hypothetical protein QWZ08_03225 [Ferruginibacter paludis]|uniref:hypothetical protein n=1 Tax=Ferruginibacter paludis TaxID=1310417 RepID=UPI0025B4C827|nr:hypothetical protein [Ferruginibacter paludis]MDN3654622.1 hypothetical protein [Ferruginibacter paludis]
MSFWIASYQQRQLPKVSRSIPEASPEKVLCYIRAKYFVPLIFLHMTGHKLLAGKNISVAKGSISSKKPAGGA